MTGSAGKTRNIVLVWLVWPLITLGIYHLVWWYKINREARDFDARIEVSPFLSLLAMTVGWLVILPPFISCYQAGLRIRRMQVAAGLPGSCSAVVGFLLMFVAGLHSLYYQHELNQVWQRYGNPPEGTEVALDR